MPAEELPRTTGRFTTISKNSTLGINTSEWFFSLRGHEISLGGPGTVTMGSCGIAPSRGAGFNSFSAGVTFLLSRVSIFESEATSSDIGTSDEGNTSGTIGTFSM